MNAVLRHGDSGPAVAQITGLLNRIGLLDDGGDSVPDPERVYDGDVELDLLGAQVPGRRVPMVESSQHRTVFCFCRSDCCQTCFGGLIGGQRPVGSTEP